MMSGRVKAGWFLVFKIALRLTDGLLACGVDESRDMDQCDGMLAVDAVIGLRRCAVC